MAIETLTRPALRRRIATSLQDAIVNGTATSGTSTTLVDTSKLSLFSDDSLNGAWVYINAGTGVGQERPITDFVKSSSTITVGYAWDTDPDSTSEYEVHRRHTVEQYNDAIDQALRRSRWSHLREVVRSDIITGNAIRNGTFSLWNSDADVPDYWGSDATLTKFSLSSLGGIESWIGQTLKVKAMVYANCAASFKVDSGVTFGSHSGTEGWELIEYDWTPVSSEGDDVRLTLPLGGGAVLTESRVMGLRGPYALRQDSNLTSEFAIWDWVYVEQVNEQLPQNIELTVDQSDYKTGFHSIHEIEIENGSPGESNPGAGFTKTRIPWTDYYVTPGDVHGGQNLYFKRKLPKNRLLTVKGLGTTIPGGDDDDTLEINSEVVELYALYRLSMVTDPGKAQAWHDQWQRIRNETRIMYPAFSQIIDNN